MIQSVNEPCLLSGDLAVQYSLSSEMILSIISPRLDSVIKGHLQGGMIYTSMYIHRLKAQLRGALRGMTSPVLLTTLLKILGIDESGLSNMINKVVTELVMEKSIKVNPRAGS